MMKQPKHNGMVSFCSTSLWDSEAMLALFNMYRLLAVIRIS